MKTVTVVVEARYSALSGLQEHRVWRVARILKCSCGECEKKQVVCECENEADARHVAESLKAREVSQ